MEVANCGDVDQNIGGWVLMDIDDGGPSFEFPDFTLNAGYSVRVYTDEVHPDFGGFSFGSDTAIWNNSAPDRAALFDIEGIIISERGYEPWTGCE